uniref:Uncharacterized protein n=1 Tax=Rangifer tarandus platyrhynchus TaxID=3082113 RepID=A0ACB0E0E0_RANTA|nr:unnamed protein product [Rangifer tarandus platyrhynchus]
MPGAGPGLPQASLDKEGQWSIRVSAPGSAEAQCDHLTGHHLAFCSLGTDAVGAKVGVCEAWSEKIYRWKDGPRSQGRSWPAIRGDKGACPLS